MIPLSKQKTQASSPDPALGSDPPSDNGKAPTPSMRGGVRMVSGMVWFASLADVKSYIQGLLDMYRAENEKANEFVASMYRSLAEKGSKTRSANTWTKMGSILVNSTDPERGKMETALQLLTDMKPLVARTEEALTNFVRIEDISAEPNSTFVLCMRYGLPERLIVEASLKTEKFTLTDEYVTV